MFRLSTLSRTFPRSMAFASTAWSTGTGASAPFAALRYSATRNLSTTQQRLNTAAKELSVALDEEIQAEKELEQNKMGGSSVPAVPGFQITTNGAEVRLTKMHGKEKIVVYMNVKHSVDIEEEFEEEEQPESEAVPVALPPFSISITKDNQSLYFDLQMVKTEEGGYDFTVDEFFLAPADNGEPKEEIGDDVYSSSGKYIDPRLHDLLFVKYLEERGFTSDFCHQLVAFATHHEHAQYVSLLGNIKKFVSA